MYVAMSWDVLAVVTFSQCTHFCSKYVLSDCPSRYNIWHEICLEQSKLLHAGMPVSCLSKKGSHVPFNARDEDETRLIQFFQTPNVFTLGLFKTSSQQTIWSLSGPFQRWKSCISVKTPVTWRSLKSIHGQHYEPDFIRFCKAQHLVDMRHFHRNQPGVISSRRIEERRADVSWSSFPLVLSTDPSMVRICVPSAPPPYMLSSFGVW